MAERRILVTGFEPWSSFTANPSERLARRLDGWRHGDAEVVGLVLPVARRAASDAVTAALRDLRPAAVVHLGLAAGREALTVERWAHNAADFIVPDNAGEQPRDEPLREDGAWRLGSRLDVDAAVAALRSAGAPAAPSDTAGRFVCNAVLYHSLTGAAVDRFAGPLGFVHLPSEETLALADQERALERLLRLLAAGPAHATAAPPLTPQFSTGETAHGHNAD